MEILFLGVGLFFTAIGLLIVGAARKGNDLLRVKGAVIGYVRAGNSADTPQTFAPVISFQHPAAGRRLFQSSLATGNFLYPVGQEVTVLADMRDPTRARIDTNGFLWFGGVFIAIGVGCSVLFFVTFRAQPISLAVAGVLSFLFVWQLWKKRNEIPDLRQWRSFVDQTVSGKVIEETRFDRMRLIPIGEMGASRRRRGRQSLFAAILLILLGGGGLFWSSRWVERRKAFLDGALSTSGRVVALEASTSAESDTFAPVVEFVPLSATSPVRFRHPVSSSHPSWEPGEEVHVLYDSANPSRAMIDQGRWNVLFPMMPGAAGMFLIALGLLALRSWWSSRRRLSVSTTLVSQD